MLHADYLRTKLRAPWNEPSFERAISAFVAAIQDRAPATPDFADGLACQRLLDAALTSAERRAPVDLAA